MTADKKKGTKRAQHPGSKKKQAKKTGKKKRPRPRSQAPLLFAIITSG